MIWCSYLQSKKHKWDFPHMVFVFLRLACLTWFSPGASRNLLSFQIGLPTGWNYVVSVALTSSQSPAYLPPEEEKCEPLYMAFHFISNRVSIESRAQQQEDFWPVSPRALYVPDPSLGIQMCDQTRLLYECWRSMLRCFCLHGRNSTYSVSHSQVGFILQQQGSARSINVAYHHLNKMKGLEM